MLSWFRSEHQAISGECLRIVLERVHTTACSFEIVSHNTLCNFHGLEILEDVAGKYVNNFPVLRIVLGGKVISDCRDSTHDSGTIVYHVLLSKIDKVATAQNCVHQN